MCTSQLMVVSCSRNGLGAQCKRLKLLTLKTAIIHLNKPFKVLHLLRLVTEMPYPLPLVLQQYGNF